MPVMDLPPLHEGKAPLAIKAYMASPNDGKIRALIIQAVEAEAARSLMRKTPQDKIDQYAKEIAQITKTLAGPDLQTANAAMDRAMPLGQLAGSQLIILLDLIEARGSAASLTRARDLMQKKNLQGTSTSRLKSAWSEMNSVAHLWAAHRYAGHLLEGDGHNLDLSVGSQVATFLSLAELIRRKGEAHIPNNSSETVLDPSTTWRVPSWVAMPQLDGPLPKVTGLY